MDRAENKIAEYTKRILLSRMRVITKCGFFGILLMNIGFSLTDKIECAGTDYNKKIYINPNFLDKINDSELDYVLEHEIMHVVLKHGSRGKNLEPERFNIAADIIVNANILNSNGGDTDSIFLSVNGGVQKFKAPDGRNGAEFTVEELYKLIPEPRGKKGKGPGSKASGGGNSNNNSPKCKDDNNEKGISGQGNDSGENDEDFEELPRSNNDGGWDSHLKPKDESEYGNELHEDWIRKIQNACEAGIKKIKNGSRSWGNVPEFAQRLMNELREPQIDWRTILNDFVQEEICDYSFTPPDRRFDDSVFFLPDYNEKDFLVKKVLFMIDTSASMNDEMITAAYSEVKGAIDQFGGKLEGWLGFFDAAIIEPKPFENENEFKVIQPFGGGGTNFHIIFKYINEHMNDDPPVSIIILTDGYADYPNEKETNNIPVLWLLNNEEVMPPWGKIARIKISEELNNAF